MHNKVDKRKFTATTPKLPKVPISLYKKVLEEFINND